VVSQSTRLCSRGVSCCNVANAHVLFNKFGRVKTGGITGADVTGSLANMVIVFALTHNEQRKQRSCSRSYFLFPN
jgi:hypothetical protein